MIDRCFASACVAVLALTQAACGGGPASDIDLAGTIVFVSEDDDGQSALYAMPAGGGKAELLAPFEGDAFALSPDRKRVAYVRTTPVDATPFRSELWVSDIDGANARRIDAASRRFESPTWSPDGLRIAHVGGPGITVIRSDGSAKSTISLADAASLDWSPDGTEIVFTGIADDALRAINVTTGTERRIAATKSFAGSPQWAHDGKSIAFTQQEDVLAGGSSIYVVNARGGTPRQVTRGHNDDSPAWSSADDRILFVRAPTIRLSGGGDVLEDLEREVAQRELYVVDADGARPRRLTENDRPEWGPEWGEAEPTRATATEEVSAGVEVPSVTGMPLRRAQRHLEQAGLRPVVRDAVFGSGPRDPYARHVVALQAPEAGARVGRGRSVELVVFDTSDPFRGREFDAAVWRRHRQCDSQNPRGRMYADLVQEHLPRGMPRARVVALLGKPTRQDQNVLEYSLGAWSSFGIDCDFLVIEFDRSDRLVRASKYQS